MFDRLSELSQLRLSGNPWHCDCASSYLAGWLRKRYQQQQLRDNNTGAWDFGAGAVCRGPGNLGGKLLVKLSYRELCDNEWASMKGLAPRLPLELVEDYMDEVSFFFSYKDDDYLIFVSSAGLMIHVELQEREDRSIARDSSSVCLRRI